MKSFNFDSFKNEMLRILGRNFQLSKLTKFLPVSHGDRDFEDRIFIFESEEEVDEFMGLNISGQIDDMKLNNSQDYEDGLKRFSEEFEKFISLNNNSADAREFKELSSILKSLRTKDEYEKSLATTILQENRKKMAENVPIIFARDIKNLWLVIENACKDPYDFQQKDIVLMVTADESLARTLADRTGGLCYARKLSEEKSLIEAVAAQKGE